MAPRQGQNTSRPDWAENKLLQTYHTNVSNGGEKIQGPLLVIHGKKDDRISAPVVLDAANHTHRLSWTLVLLPNVSPCACPKACGCSGFAGHKVQSGRPLCRLGNWRCIAQRQNWCLDPVMLLEDGRGTTKPASWLSKLSNIVSEIYLHPTPPLPPKM